MLRAAQALAEVADHGEVPGTLIRQAATALRADAAAVLYRVGADLTVAANQGLPAGTDLQTLAACADGRVSAGDGTVCTTAGNAAATAILTGAAAIGRAEDAAPLRTVLASPMAWEREVRAVLLVAWAAEQEVDEPDVAALDLLAAVGAVAARNASAFERAQHAARTDALTGVLNHGAMQLRIREEIARAERDGGALACAIIDLDDFKGVNDRLGHQAGDELLRRVAQVLSEEVRPYDAVARYGGDEFVLVLPGSDSETAAQVAGRVRERLDNGCSIGVASWQPGVTAAELIEHADRALLVAKRTGKGRVAMADAELESQLALLHAEDGSPAAVAALAAAIEERDGYTTEQTDDVVRLARGVAMVLGLDRTSTGRIAQAALLHDVGKLGIPRAVLDKRSPLTQEEWEMLAEHPVVGERILKRSPELAALAPIVRHEHEHWDGTGYPDGLAGQAIPLGSRIILACDAFVAMTVDRPYRPARTAHQAATELCKGSGSQFDPDIVEALLELSGAREAA